MKINQLLNLRQELISIAKEPIKLRTAFNIAKFVSQTEQDAQFFQRRLQQLIEKFGERDSQNNFIFENNGASIQIRADDIEACNKELEEINNYEIDTPKLEIYYEDLPDGLTVTTLLNIIDYIVKD